MYEVAAKKESPMYGAVFGRFISDEVAREALDIVPKGIRKNFDLEVRESKLGLNIISVGGGKTIDVTTKKPPQEILSDADSFGYVHGYVKISLYEMMRWNCDKKKLEEVLSQRLVGNENMRVVSFGVVGVEDGYILTMHVKGQVENGK